MATPRATSPPLATSDATMIPSSHPRHFPLRLLRLIIISLPQKDRACSSLGISFRCLLIIPHIATPMDRTFQRRGSTSTFHSATNDFAISDTAEDIRSRTAFLADMPYRRSPSSASLRPPVTDENRDPRRSFESESGAESESDRERGSLPSSYKRPPTTTVLVPTLAPLQERVSPTSSSISSSPEASPSNASPSGLSRMFKSKSKSRSRSPAPEVARPRFVVRHPTEEGREDSTGSLTPTVRPTESTALLPAPDIQEEQITSLYGSVPPPPSKPTFIGRTLLRSKVLTQPSTYAHVAKDAAASLPAVILGLLLNVLDGVSYGFIMFPAGATFMGKSLNAKP